MFISLVDGIPVLKHCIHASIFPAVWVMRFNKWLCKWIWSCAMQPSAQVKKDWRFGEWHFAIKDHAESRLNTWNEFFRLLSIPWLFCTAPGPRKTSGGYWQEAVHAIQHLELPADVISYNAAISACEKGHHWQSARLFNMWVICFYEVFSLADLPAIEITSSNQQVFAWVHMHKTWLPQTFIVANAKSVHVLNFFMLLHGFLLLLSAGVCWMGLTFEAFSPIWSASTRHWALARLDSKGFKTRTMFYDNAWYDRHKEILFGQISDPDAFFVARKRVACGKPLCNAWSSTVTSMLTCWVSMQRFRPVKRPESGTGPWIKSTNWRNLDPRPIRCDLNVSRSSNNLWFVVICQFVCQFMLLFIHLRKY